MRKLAIAGVFLFNIAMILLGIEMCTQEDIGTPGKIGLTIMVFLCTVMMNILAVQAIKKNLYA